MNRKLALALAAACGVLLLAALAFAGPLAPSLSRAAPPTEPTAGDIWQRARDRMNMVFIPGGTFSMGSEQPELDFLYNVCMKYNIACYVCKPGTKTGACDRAWFEDERPPHQVTLDGFWLDKTEVTNAQYAACVQAGACALPSETGFYVRQNYYYDPSYANYPVVYVDWSQAADYCKWTGARLPTEAEWEYAAAGTEGRRFPWGAEFDGTKLNFCDKNCWLPGGATEWDDSFEETAPVGSFPPGASWAGVLDMAGNAAEWVADWYGPGYYGQSPEHNPLGPESGEARVQRGGSWGLQPLYASTSYRSSKLPDESNIYAGFRCARGAENR
jgi:formylglycine-generating enzyme required for sulfatase activity